jgi:hypothetical protein
MEHFLLSDSLKSLIILSKSGLTNDDMAYLKKNEENESKLFALAERHRITPLVWSNLQKTDLFSTACREQFQLAARQNQINAIHAKSIQGKLQLIQTELGVNGYFLKGIGIAERFYHDIGERHVLDLDWFVGPEGVEMVSDKLISMGYVASPNITQFNHAQWKYFKSTHHDIYFSAPSSISNLPIELHWKLRSPWSGFILNPEVNMNGMDEFLYLCVHGTEHGWFRLKWLLDLPRIIDKRKFDWDELWSRARELNCIQQLSISLLVLEALSLMPLPGILRDRISTNQFRSQLLYINRVINANDSFNENDGNRWRYFNYLMGLRNSKWDLSFMKLVLTSPADWQLLKLPSSVFPLYFLLRPFLWIYRRVGI